MTTKEVYTMLTGVNIPCVYHHFADNSGQQPPFICFYYPQDDDFNADNCNYSRINQLIVELYTDNKDFTLEKTLETALSNSGLVWSKVETYIESENMYEVAYTMDVVMTEEVITNEQQN